LGRSGSNRKNPAVIIITPYIQNFMNDDNDNDLVWMMKFCFLTKYPAPTMIPIKKLGTREAIIIMELSTTAMELIRSRQKYTKFENSGRNFTM
jgi:hypothetical protein